MNLPIHGSGRRNDRRRARRALTLLEITVVLTILGVLMAVVLPNFGPLRVRGQLRTATRNLAALARYARAEAIYGHHIVTLRLDLENGAYRLDLMIDSIPASKRKGEDLHMVEAIRELPENVFVERVVFYDGIERQDHKIVSFDFSPRGSATPATIVLADTRGRCMTLEIFGTIGAVEIYPGTPPDDEGKPERPT